MIQNTHALFANCMLDLNCFPICSCYLAYLLSFLLFTYLFHLLPGAAALNHVPYLKSQFNYDYIQSLDKMHFQLP